MVQTAVCADPSKGAGAAPGSKFCLVRRGDKVVARPTRMVGMWWTPPDTPHSSDDDKTEITCRKVNKRDNV